MNNELEELLDYISDRVIGKEKWNKVRDYITNLQQENERKDNIIDKAIEYIDRRDLEWGSAEHEHLLEILKGEDK